MGQDSRPTPPAARAGPATDGERRGGAASGASGGPRPGGASGAAAEPVAAGLAADVVAARNGDPLAFARLHRRHAGAVGAVLLARVPAQEVDDLCQEVFLAAWRALPTLVDEARFLPWLATIARRRAARWHRDRRPDAEPLEALGDAGPIDRAPAAGQDGAEILATLRTLPDAYRETLTLRLVQGLSGPEIATLTGRTADSVRVHLSRGRQLLREALARRGWP